MRKQIDRSGLVFGRLKIIKFDRREKQNSYWICQCSCGIVKSIRYQSLIEGNTKSCGCLKSEQDERMKKNGCRDHPGAYESWRKMIQRCTNEKVDAYKWYGGRGITVDSEWMDFSKFVKDMGDRPDGYSIERINSNLGYSPENCKWIKKSEQQKNTRKTRRFMVGGEVLCLSDLARRFGINIQTLHQRLKRGWDLHRAISAEHGIYLEELEAA